MVAKQYQFPQVASPKAGVGSKKRSVEGDEEMMKKLKETQKRKIFEINDIKQHLEELTDDGKSHTENCL